MVGVATQLAEHCDFFLVEEGEIRRSAIFCVEINICRAQQMAKYVIDMSHFNSLNYSLVACTAGHQGSNKHAIRHSLSNTLQCAPPRGLRGSHDASSL